MNKKSVILQSQSKKHTLITDENIIIKDNLQCLTFTEFI